MDDLTNLTKMISGSFNNDEQVSYMRSIGNLEYPKACHVNTICNDKIYNLPKDFEGIFLLEESYYDVNGKCTSMPHLFLLTKEDSGVKLESYEIPEGYTKENFKYENITSINYNDLKKSPKFNPIIYKNNGDGSYYGKSISMFSPVLKFTLEETFSENMLKVSEIFEVNGRRTFGYDEPIEYKRKKI